MKTDPTISDTTEHSSNSRELSIERFRFTGSGGEYFGIWIVNILLTIVTLGIYSAWAKVRNKQYFYGNTYLQDSSFEYTASPVQILKGRILAVVVFIAYQVVGAAVPFLGLILTLLLMVAIPWIVVNSLAFNARYSSYRGINFHFQRNLKRAYVVYLFIPIGLLVAFAALFAGIGFLSASTINPQDPTGFSLTSMLPVLIVFVLGFVAYGYITYISAKFAIDHMAYGGKSFKLRLKSAKPFIRIYAEAMLIGIVGFGLIGVAFAGSINLASLAQSDGFPFELLLPYALSFVVYFAMYAYTSSKTYNLINQKTSIARHRLRANTTTVDLGLLYFTNSLFIILTLGFFIPWAKVRTAKYLAYHTAMQVEGNLDDFIASSQEEAGVWGEELGEMFDVDLGI